MDPMIFFPKDIAHKIMSELNLFDIVRCTQVSKKWNGLASDNILWRPWIEPAFPKFLNSLPEGMNIRQYVNSSTLMSLDQTIERIKIFMQKVHKNENHVFECYFSPSLPLCWLKVEFGIFEENRFSRHDKKKYEVHSHEHYIFVGKLPEPDRSLSPDKVVSCESRNMFGIESNLNLLCQLTTKEFTKKISDEISALHVPCVQELEKEHTINYIKNANSGKKKKSHCIIA